MLSLFPIYNYVEESLFFCITMSKNPKCMIFGFNICWNIYIKLWINRMMIDNTKSVSVMKVGLTCTVTNFTITSSWEGWMWKNQWTVNGVQLCEEKRHQIGRLEVEWIQRERGTASSSSLLLQDQNDLTWRKKIRWIRWW